MRCWLDENSSRLNPHAEAVYKQRESGGCTSLKSLQLHKENPAGSNFHDGTQRSMDDCVGDFVLSGHRRSQDGQTFWQQELQDEV